MSMTHRIVRVAFDNVERTLCDIEGVPVKPGDRRFTFRGVPVTVLGGEAPHKPGSTGRVVVQDDHGVQHEYFPSVLDLCWYRSDVL